MPKIRKKSSKRITVRERASVKRKVANHHRKIKKTANRLKRTGEKIPFKSNQKRNQVPNSFPLKDELLTEMEQELQREKALLKEKKKEMQMEKIQGTETFKFEESIANAEIIKQDDNMDEKYGGLTKQEYEDAEKLLDPERIQAQSISSISKKGNFREIKRAIDLADIVIHVLDSRDPEGTRSKEIEEIAENSKKKLIYILNKIDLIPQENLKKWKKYFKSQNLLCLSFRANKFRKNKNEKSEDQQDDNNNQNENIDDQLQDDCIEKVMNILFKYQRKFQEKKQKDFVSAAVVGFTNTGKSSLINILKNKIIVPTGSSPFLTKAIKEVKLSNSVILIDTPGVMVQGIVNEENNGERMRIVYSALQVEDIKNPIESVRSIIQKIDKDELLRHYRVADFGDQNNLEAVQKFLQMVSIKKGLVSKQEVEVPISKQEGQKKPLKNMKKLENQILPDIEQAARRVIRDFLGNRLNYFSEAPALS